MVKPLRRGRLRLAWMALILERKLRLDGTHEDFMCEPLLVRPGERAVLRYRIDREWVVAGGALVVPKGSENLAHYWMDRPYNVYHFVRGAKTLALYCNVAEPIAIRDDLVEYLDLAVDVLIDPKGAALVLDEDELPDDLSPERRKLVARALEQLQTDPRRLVADIEREGRRFTTMA
jgi:protein associated with RNAse G/E